MSTGLRIRLGHNSFAFKRDIADLTPKFLASYEQEATAPLVIFSFCSVIITAWGFSIIVWSCSSSQDGKNGFKSTHIITFSIHFFSFSVILRYRKSAVTTG